MSATLDDVIEFGSRRSDSRGNDHPKPELIYDFRQPFRNVIASTTAPTIKATGIPVPIEGAGAALHVAQGSGRALVVLVCASTLVIAPMHNQMAIVSDLISPVS